MPRRVKVFFVSRLKINSYVTFLDQNEAYLMERERGGGELKLGSEQSSRWTRIGWGFNNKSPFKCPF